MRIHELGHIVLYVTSLLPMADFYRDVLGFGEIARRPSMALFSSGRTHHELLLIEIGGTPKEHRFPEPGLYHIGFKIGDSDRELAEARRELVAQGVSIVGATDHTVTHSLYILDPDGNELELYVDISDAWKTDPEAILQPPRRLDIG